MNHVLMIILVVVAGNGSGNSQIAIETTMATCQQTKSQLERATEIKWNAIGSSSVKRFVDCISIKQ